MHSLEKAVLDANIIFHSRGQIPVETVYLTESVFDEIESKSGKMVLEKLDLNIMQPSDEAKEQVMDKSDQINSPTSPEDEYSLALALDKGLTLITDDKALQNLALHLDTEFKGFNTEEVSEKRRWKKVCSNCGSNISSLPCSSCGSSSVSRKRV